MPYIYIYIYIALNYSRPLSHVFLTALDFELLGEAPSATISGTSKRADTLRGIKPLSWAERSLGAGGSGDSHPERMEPRFLMVFEAQSAKHTETIDLKGRSWAKATD